MKCIKCRTVNIHNANYCKKCAYQFSENEQKAAEKWTFVGFLKFLVWNNYRPSEILQR